jgi:hypothetical protein
MKAFQDGFQKGPGFQDLVPGPAQAGRVEKPPAGSWLAAPASSASLEIVVILSGRMLEAGAVLGRIAESGKCVALAPSEDDGTETAAGVLWDGVDASDGDRKGIAITRTAAVRADALLWPDGITSPQKAAALAQLAAAGIKAR